MAIKIDQADWENVTEKNAVIKNKIVIYEIKWRLDTPENIVTWKLDLKTLLRKEDIRHMDKNTENLKG